MKKKTLAAFARNHRVSKQAVSKWKAQGHLVIIDGLVDVEASDQKLQAAGLGRYSDQNLRLRQRQPRHVTPPTSRSLDGIVDADANAPGSPDSQPLDANLTRFLDDMASGRTATMADAAEIKENALALKHALQAQRLQGELIELSKAEAIFFEEARSMRDVWLNFPSRVGAHIAADLGVDIERVLEVLTMHIHQLLSDIGEPEPDFGDAVNGAVQSEIPT